MKTQNDILFLYAAKSEERLKEYIKNILQHLNEQDDQMLTIRNISYTLQTGRTAMDKRVMFIVREIYLN